MIKVKKDLSEIPECLENGGKYNCDDVMKKLESIYHGKCAYCEQKADLEHEHYRPVSKYKWLEKSWSNLIPACAKCNQIKLARFELLDDKNKIDEKKAEEILQEFQEYNIHTITRKYNELERPIILNPEYDNLNGRFKFEKDGNIIPIDYRAEYTIKTCGLNRPVLKSLRVEIIKEYVDKCNNRVTKDEIKSIFTEFLKNCKPEKSFTAFRKYIYVNHLSKIISDTINNNKPT